jgi:hypothetical protein
VIPPRPASVIIEKTVPAGKRISEVIPRRTERYQSPPEEPQTDEMPQLDTRARRALTSSGQGSIRERATAAIIKAGRPLSMEEVYDKLKVDGNPLPQHNAKDIIKNILNNKAIFKTVANGRYVPIIDQN